MAKNVKEKKYPIKLDKERNLKYDMNAFIELEDIFGSIDAVFKPFENGEVKVKTLRTLLWAGLVHEDESLTEKEVGSLIELADMQKLGEVIVEALSGAMPQAKNG